jgi:hypothetical protein
MFGYAEATNAMWWGVFHETLDIYDRAIRSAEASAPDAKPASWFNPRPEGQALYVTAGAQNACAPSNWFGVLGGTASSQGWNAASMPVVSPFDVWLNMMPLRGGPAAWPMAFFMLSAGVPKSVAWPTAEANAAMMEAAEVASEQLRTVFASYRSDGGHAAAANVTDTSSAGVPPLAPFWSHSA